MREAAEGLKPVQFELGGNDPAIVLEDVNLGDAIPKLVASVFRRSGQFCFAVKRIYVAAPIYGRFVEAFLAETAKFRIGHPLAPGVTFGPMNNEAQYKFIVGLTERARSAGARLVPLGEKLAPEAWHEGYYLQPVVVPDAAPDLEVVRVEQFGPIIPIVRVKDEAEAVALANDCELGLASSIWTPDAARAVALARRIEAGMTFINNHGTSRLGQRNVPFGGVKESGIGRESSVVGLAEYVTYHAINLHK
jgi:acyl-CoA reductase-like NAD-dependent aldehyde dehydrogenase